MCPEGYEVDENDNTNCLDFNECAMLTNPCSGEKPHCINMDGSYTCTSTPDCGHRKSLYYRSDECCQISSDEPVCGMSSATNLGSMTEKVIGGVKSDTARWPWQVFILISLGVQGSERVVIFRTKSDLTRDKVSNPLTSKPPNPATYRTSQKMWRYINIR